MRDFTLKQLEALYKSILQNGYKIISYDQYVAHAYPRGKYVIMRHDVDADPAQALKLAKLERAMGIRSSYYFRSKPAVFVKEIIEAIVNLGHEIGYHYEDLAKHGGDVIRAIKSFEDTLHAFRKLYPVQTICMHGSPLSRHHNNALWDIYDYREFGIKGDINIDIQFSRHWYLTDTGRGWNSRFNVRDKVSSPYNIPVGGTQSLIELFDSRKTPPRVMVNIHPQRWREEYSSWAVELVSQSVKNVIKLFYINKLEKQ